MAVLRDPSNRLVVPRRWIDAVALQQSLDNSQVAAESSIKKASVFGFRANATPFEKALERYHASSSTESEKDSLCSILRIPLATMILPLNLRRSGWDTVGPKQRR